MLTDQPGMLGEGASSPITVQDLVAAYENLHLPTLKPNTRPPLRCKVRKYFGPLLALPLGSLSVPIILGWVNDIRAMVVTKNGQVVMDPKTQQPKLMPVKPMGA